MKKILRFKEIDYVIRYPEGFSEEEKYPLLFYIHGAGGRGRNIDLIYNHCFFNETDKYNLNVVSIAPQCYEDSWFSIFEQLQEFVKFAINQEFIDKERVYVMGASMGGYTTWQLAMSRPEWFAAIVPICGGGMYWNAARMLHMGVWAFHGSDDKAVYPEESRKMVNSLNNKGGNAKLTIYEGEAHNAWTPTFNNEEMWTWLLAQKNHYKATQNEYDDVVRFG